MHLISRRDRDLQKVVLKPSLILSTTTLQELNRESVSLVWSDAVDSLCSTHIIPRFCNEDNWRGHFKKSNFEFAIFSSSSPGHVSEFHCEVFWSDWASTLRNTMRYEAHLISPRCRLHSHNLKTRCHWSSETLWSETHREREGMFKPVSSSSLILYRKVDSSDTHRNRQTRHNIIYTWMLKERVTLFHSWLKLHWNRSEMQRHLKNYWSFLKIVEMSPSPVRTN